jgi:peroxiredoxin
MRIVLLTTLLALTISTISVGDESKADGKIGSKTEGKIQTALLPDFSLRDFRGKEHTLSGLADKKAIVIVFTGTSCPLAKLYGPRLETLHEKYAKQGVAFLGINSNRQDTLEKIAHYTRVHNVSFPMLKDNGNKVAELFDAERTPEVFLLDAKRHVRYRGRIDDQYGVGYATKKASRPFLANAIDAVLAGRKVDKAYVEPVGCFIGKVQKRASSGELTYSKHIAPILNKRCVECHREGQIAPFPLTSYDEVVGWTDTIREVVEDGRMPPWHASPLVGKFSNDKRLVDAERKALFAWIDDGAPEGDRKHLPPVPKFAEGWRIEEPDVVFPIPRPQKVPAEGTVEYRYVAVNPHWEEGKWIQEAEARPDNTGVVHHILLYHVPPDKRGVSPQLAFANSIATFAPGMPPTVYRKGTAKYVPAGSKLVFQLHYTPNGSPQTDRSYVGLRFADPSSVRKEVRSQLTVNLRLKIPPGASSHKVTASYRFGDDYRLVSLFPHMHLRGKAFHYEAKYPDGSTEMLLEVPQYDFNWQNTYVLAEPKKMPRGTVVHCTAWYDNSGTNLSNPDPTSAVRWGDQTWQEMMVGAFDVALEEQDLSLGGPDVKPRSDGSFDVTFQYRPTGKPESVHLIGSFQEWNKTSHEMTKIDGLDKNAPDLYRVRATIPAGDYEYKFLLDGDDYRRDPGCRERKGRYGNSVLRLRAAPRKS